MFRVFGVSVVFVFIEKWRCNGIEIRMGPAVLSCTGKHDKRDLAEIGV